MRAFFLLLTFCCATSFAQAKPEMNQELKIAAIQYIWKLWIVDTFSSKPFTLRIPKKGRLVEASPQFRAALQKRGLSARSVHWERTNLKRGTYLPEIRIEQVVLLPQNQARVRIHVFQTPDKNSEFEGSGIGCFLYLNRVGNQWVPGVTTDGYSGG